MARAGIWGIVIKFERKFGAKFCDLAYQIKSVARNE